MRRQAPIRVLITGKSPMDCQLLFSAISDFSSRLVMPSAATSIKGVLQQLESEAIDVLLLSADLMDRRLAGLQMLRRIHSSYPEVKIVVLFDPSENDVEVKALCRGARGVFCRSETNLAVLRECIDAICQGRIWTNRPRLLVLLRALHDSARGLKSEARKGGQLTKREQDVAKLVAEGLGSKEVTRRLGISEHALSNYLFAIYNKLGLSGTDTLDTTPQQHSSQQFGSDDGVPAQSPLHTGKTEANTTPCQGD